jgi:hypothetical protein
MTATQTPGAIAESIRQAWAQHLLRQNQPRSPHPYVYASAWRPCDRRLVLEMREPHAMPAWPAEVLAKFRRGEDRERDLLLDLSRVGRDAEPPFKVIGQQEAFRLKDRKGRVAISGKVDARLHIGDVRAPLEVKTWSSQLTDRIETFSDCFESPWTRAGAYQLLSYLFGAGEPWGFLLLDRSGIPALLPVELDAHLDHVEEFLTRAERAIDHLEAGTLPDYLAHDAAECQRCAFYGHTCNPPLSAKGLDIISDAALETMLARREAIKATGQEYDALDREIKDRLRGTEHAIIGGFEVKGRWSKQSRLELPAALKQQYTVTDLKGRFSLEITHLSTSATTSGRSP